MPATLWLIQTAQEQVHLMVVVNYLWIGPSPTNVTLALVDYWLRFLRHRAVSLLQDRLIIPHLREIILLRTLSCVAISTLPPEMHHRDGNHANNRRENLALS
jgi:hypothetical protein